MFFVYFRWLFIILCRQWKASAVGRRWIACNRTPETALSTRCVLSLLSLISSSLILPLSSTTSRRCLCC